ncbi:MAG: hypothetical protein U9N43_04745 [Euryarchaeota archaeon]|nr:hypothetical protein [Euryarchaeota archaeon]
MKQIVMISGKGSSGKTHEFIRRRLSCVPGVPAITSAEGAIPGAIKKIGGRTNEDHDSL